MRATAGGAAFPAYKLLYSNEGNTLEGTRVLEGAANPVWSTDGESISCATTSDGENQALILTEGLFGHAFWLEFQLKFMDDGTDGSISWTQLGLGLADSTDEYATIESSALDITVSGADLNFGSYSVYLQVNAMLDTPEFAVGEWVSVALEVVGHNVGCWFDGVYAGSFSAVRENYDTGTGGIYDCVRISNARSRRADHYPARIKKIRVYQMDLGELG